ncbi:MAG: hypothetical protein JRG73_20235 [Deltaproteobacteria bacterium]|nr:hypothetical protein [Deltaproteobacteria bacterium]
MSMRGEAEKKMQPFSFDDPRQERIYRRLLLVGPGPASFYKDICRLIKDKTLLESVNHVIAHLFREIESALRDVLESLTDRSKREKKDCTSDKETHKTKISVILKSLDISETDPVAKAWLGLAGKEGLISRVHRKSLDKPPSIDTEFLQFCDRMDTILDFILDKFEAQYLRIVQVLDELLAISSPTSDDVKRLKNNIPNNLVSYGYFFNNLSNYAWLEPLKSEGFFQHPPEPVHYVEEGTIAFPVWPQSRYLARMAKEKPETVLEIILEIPLTENFRVNEDLIDAACAMPPHLAAQIAARETEWLSSQERFSRIDERKFAKLVIHLARGSQVQKALDLSRAILAVFPSKKHEEIEIEGETCSFPSDPEALFDAWHYQEIIEKITPELMKAAGKDALCLFSDLLEDAVRFSRRDPNEESGDDYSYIWWAAIEEDSKDTTHDLKRILVLTVRDVAEPGFGIGKLTDR